MGSGKNYNPVCGIKVIVSVLFLLGIAFLCPIVSDEASAEFQVRSNNQSSASIAIAMSNSFDLDLAVGTGTTFAEVIGNVLITSNNVSGYRLLIQSLETSNMVSGNEAIGRAITSIPSPTTKQNFGDNMWGYYIGETVPDNDSKYHPMSIVAEEAIAVQDLTGTAMTMNFQLAFGAKVDSSLPAGAYSNTVVLSAVANPREINDLSELMYMQDMTTGICNSTESGTTKRAIDLRDNKAYWIARLRDGKCWMVQNLALDIDVDYRSKLTSSNTDLPAEWSWPYAMMTTRTAANTVVNTVAGTNSWNMGKYVLAIPMINTSCGSNITTDLSACVKLGFVDVSDEANFQPEYAVAIGKWEGANATTNNTWVAVDCAEWSGTGANKVCLAGKYDAHYLVGNYYQWNAATAGSGASITTDDGTSAAASLCPKGWRLPTRAENGVLLNGLTVDKVLISPYYFASSGGINLESSTLYSSGYGNYLWSGTAAGPNNALHVMIGGSSFATSTTNGRAFGFSVRCVAR